MPREGVKGVETGEERHERRWEQDTPLPAAATLLLSSSASEVYLFVFSCVLVSCLCVYVSEAHA